MTTSMKRRHRDRVVRRGLGMLIESDFYTTAAGREHFSNQIQSIRYCVQETCNFDVLFAYLTTRNYDFAYDKSHNVRPKRNIRMAMQHEVSMYAIAQKEGNGLDKAVEDCKYRMKRYGVTVLTIPCLKSRPSFALRPATDFCRVRAPCAAQPARDSAAALAVHGARAGGEAHVRWPLQP